MNNHLSSYHKSNHESIPQVDGNVSMETLDSSLLSNHSSITVPPLSATPDSLADSFSDSNSSSLHVPQSSDQYSVLPVIYSANARSIFPKFADLVHKLQNSRIDIGQISETWQDINKNEHNQKIDVLE